MEVPFSVLLPTDYQSIDRQPQRTAPTMAHPLVSTIIAISLMASMVIATFLTGPGLTNSTLHGEDACRLEKQSSGFIHLPNRVDTHYFYWFFESRNKPSTDPLVLWIPGGPGEAGTYGLLAENGPCNVNDNFSFTSTNPFSWTAVANMVWVDLPANTGFSYSTVAEDDEFTDEQVAESVFWFLQEFFKKHRELQGRQLFLAGESYGGHFVPSVAHYIWKQKHNKLFFKADTELIPINLHGIAIGNGLTNSVEVYSHTVDMAVSNAYNITLVNETQLAAMKAAASKMRDLITACQSNTSMCQEAGSFWQTQQFSPLLKTGRNPYDIRKECDTAISNPVLCQLKMRQVKAYLDTSQVRKFLGVNSSFGEWSMLNLTINANFFGAPHYSGFISVADKVSDLLDAGLRVLMYVGDADLLCNIYAVKATAERLQWGGAQGFNVAKETAYLTASRIAGTVRSYSRLTYVVVHNAGHMAPGDRPEVALDMISKFIRNETL
ncbi:hypothetical protein PHYBOEH_002083 [Phytophthora boehmeriae]|uniref:Carboxypeptidase n=1 Tax=Phytophthora boehmeriae TaxID=109152 RepID=A0A8T1XC32_9STRA|nr:hypothetical protein PHYBOEH_002083 [Phytophthora boehmeriae]